MVMTRYIILAAAAVLFPAIAFAGDFTATVDRNTVSAGDSFTLQLTLSGAEAKASPDISPLRPDFTIASQGQSSNTTIINGKVRSSTGWELTLIPKTEGKAVIPALRVDTSDGTLDSQPITIEVNKGSAGPEQNGHSHTTITAHASVSNPYENQSIFYTAKIVARTGVADLTLGDLKMDNAVVELSGKPKVYQSTENGMPVEVVEVHYIITPLSSGKIVIPPLTVEGKVATDNGGLMGNDDFFNQAFADPFTMMRQMDKLAGMVMYKPFSAASNEVSLDVKSAAASMNPWLPLTSLEVEDSIDTSQAAHAGEPIARTITLTAHGMSGKQLPSLEAQQNHADFKVYADKPETSEKIQGENILGKRRETYNLIPLKDGTLTLPEIRIAWWDTTTDHVAYAVVPARSLKVLPGAAATSTPPAEAIPSAAPQPQTMPAAPAQPIRQLQQPPTLLYAIIGILAVTLLAVVAWAMTQRRSEATPESEQKTKHTEPPIASQKNPTTDLLSFSAITTPEQLNHYIRAYAHDHWGFAENMPLEILLARTAVSPGQKHRTDRFIRDLTSALYAGQMKDINALKEEWKELSSPSPQPPPEAQAFRATAGTQPALITKGGNAVVSFALNQSSVSFNQWRSLMNTKTWLMTAAALLIASNTFYYDDATAQVAPPKIVSGGVGMDGMTAIDQAQDNYRLKLVYTEPNGDYLANVNVIVRDHTGQTVAKTESNGPVVLMNLTPGTYTVTSSLDGSVKTEKVHIRAHKLETYYIKLPTA